MGLLWKWSSTSLKVNVSFHSQRTSPYQDLVTLLSEWAQQQGEVWHQGHLCSLWGKKMRILTGKVRLRFAHSVMRETHPEPASWQCTELIDAVSLLILPQESRAIPWIPEFTLDIGHSEKRNSSYYFFFLCGHYSEANGTLPKHVLSQA